MAKSTKIRRIIMSYGYLSDGGRSYTITNPLTPSRWINYLISRQYQAAVDQVLQGNSLCINRHYHHSANCTGMRQFYIHDHKTGKAFHLNAIENNPNYSCKFYLNKTVLSNDSDGVKTDVCVFLPLDEKREMWKVTVTNPTSEEKEISLFSVTGFSANGTMGGTCTYADNTITNYAFPYHVYYEDKEKAEKQVGYYYLTTNKTPYACDMSTYRFWGNYAMVGIPAAVKTGKCSDIAGEVEDFVGAMQHKFTLAPGQSESVYFAIGCAAHASEITDYQSTFTAEYAQSKLDESDKHWENISNASIVKTNDEHFDAFINYWLKRQSAHMTFTHRGGPSSPMRNDLQDALGYALCDPEGTVSFMYDVLKRQRSDGYIKQWMSLDGGVGGLCLLDHCDGPAWIGVCLPIFVNQCGRPEMLDELIPYSDGGEGTLYEHIVKAIEYASRDLGGHGLCLMRDGDWTDPMNGIGRLGIGESTWTTLAVIYGAQLALDLCKYKNDEKAIALLEGIVDSLSKAVNDNAWDEESGYYFGGWHDDGKPFGYSEDGIIVLNSQSWAVLTGVATGERLARVRKNIERISTVCGVFVNYPPFMEWNPRWGRISIKRPGTTENGCVYCHASMFKAAGDARIGDGEALYDTLYRTTPFSKYNPTEINRQLPLFITNYYYTLEGSPNFGRANTTYGTGTVTWFQMLALESLLGMKKTIRGIEIAPVLPADWDNVEISRTFKNAKYHVVYKKSASGITVNGKAIEGNLLPYADGESYEVVVGI